MPAKVPNTYNLTRGWSVYTSDAGTNYGIFTTISNITVNLQTPTITPAAPLMPDSLKVRHVVAVDSNFNRTKVPIFTSAAYANFNVNDTFLKDNVLFTVMAKYGESTRIG